MPQSFVFLLALVGCSDPSPASNPGNLYSIDVTTVLVEVDYASGAEPYTESTLGSDPWTLFETNADALFGGTKTLVYPTALSDMGDLGDQGSGPFSRSDVLALSGSSRDQTGTDSQATFHVIFLDGYFEDSDGETRDTVLGVSFGGTSVIAMFKPVIEGAASLDVTRRFVEQTTLVHEFGHAVGLVNNGVALTAEHHDAENGAHCTDDACVMYYAIETPSDVAAFVQQYVTTGSTVLFGDDCLADAQAARD